MAYTSIIYRAEDHIAGITLNRPEMDNIINQPLAQELEDVCARINQDVDIYVAVITGAARVSVAVARATCFAVVINAGVDDASGTAVGVDAGELHDASALPPAIVSA